MPLPVLLSKNDPRASKKDFGHVLIVAGSPSMLGAAALSSLAALRSGAGMVTAAVPKGLNLTLQKKISNCVMTLPLASSLGGVFSFKALDQLKMMWERFDAVAIGPGLGRENTTLQLARAVVQQCPKPLVIDADALYALAKDPSVLLKAKAARILTPHSGEMSRLTGAPVKAIEAGRQKAARDFARRYNCVLLLKGHRTVVSCARGKTYINRTGHVGMATAGSGDVLTGMIAALLAQGNIPYNAACWGAFLHGKAGDLAAKSKFKRGMIATDIIECIPYVLS